MTSSGSGPDIVPPGTGDAPDSFYRRLPAVPRFDDATAAAGHVDLPDDWWVAIADVAGSTAAIAAGAYKDVNTIGVACIAAVANIDRRLELPFVFGGDGASFALPATMVDAVQSALRGSQRLARDGFGLVLRAGLVRVSALRADGFATRVGKLRMSPWVTQAALSGSGWAEAERRVKTPGAHGVTMVNVDDEPAAASFEGFECRWQGVPAFNGHKLALLVAACDADPEVNRKSYSSVLECIRAIYGDEAQHHPLRAERLRLSFSPGALSHEWRVRALWRGAAGRIGYFASLLFQNVAGCYLFLRGRDTEATQWTRYRSDMVANTDYRKFDGVLRMVIDGSDAQAAALESFLEEGYRAGRLAYGLHKSRAALITCMVRSYNGEHQHFVDGSDGGYAMAAAALKPRLEQLKQTREKSA